MSAYRERVIGGGARRRGLARTLVHAAVAYALAYTLGALLWIDHVMGDT